MSFQWPELLWGLAALPLCVGAYLLLQRRRKHLALRYANLSLVRDALARGAGWRRHVPPLLILAALATMIVATARPEATILLPSKQETIILAIDVSGSMRATDVQPTRIAAAQAAARAFVEDLPSTVRVGIVTFAGTASLVQPPTSARDDLLGAIDRFQVQRGTAVGSAILVSLKTLVPDVVFDLRSQNPRPKQDGGARALGSGDPTKPPKEPPAPVEPGSHGSAVIVLLTDGQTTTGPDPIESAKMASERGVRVYTVGVGTPKGEVLAAEGWSMRVRLDEDTLKNIANLTRGEYFYAGSADDLRKIYDALNTRFVFERKTIEVTAIFAAAAALLTIAAAALSVLWFHRIV
ncbi:MAG: VWA domain-containing protein [Burkholderiales bacterium]|nr:VWA domain-containing protein [Burkholderiales bacterium]